MTELKYIKDGADECYRSTPCPVKLKTDEFSGGNPVFYHGVMVGSESCSGGGYFTTTKPCKHFGGDTGKYTLICNHPDL